MPWNKYPAYEKYKDSGVPWLGKIPAHWEVRRLKYLAPAVTTKLIKKPRELRYIGLEDIESTTGKLIENKQKSQNNNDIESTVSFFRKGDVLFGKLRPYLAKAWLANFDGVCTTELLVLRASSKTLSHFLLYQVFADNFINIVNSQTYGTKMPRANWEQIGNIRLPLPPLSEQRAIAEFLDRETAKIDRLINKKKRLIELLREKRTALITHAVTRGLNPDVPLKDSGVPWLGKIPAHWEVRAVKRIAKRIQTGSTPPTNQLVYYENGTIPWFGPGSFGDDLILSRPVKFLSDKAIKDKVARLFTQGTVMVVTIGATLGKVGFLQTEASCNQQITGITFNTELVFPKFGAYQFKIIEPVLRESASSATLPIIDQQKVGCLPLALPPLFEQRAIAEFLDRETAKIDRLISKIEEAIEKLKEYHTALITAAVTGKIKVIDNLAESRESHA